MSVSFSNLYLRWHFRNESTQARQIALERPRNWEHLLTLNLLGDLLAKWKSAFDRINTSPNRVLEHTDWLKEKMFFLLDVAKKINPTICHDLVAAWGVPGKPGDSVAIKRAIAKLDESCRELYEWEVEVASTSFPRGGHVKALMIGEARFLIKSTIEEFAKELSASLADPARLGKRHINLDYKMSPNWNQFTSECEKWLAQESARQ
ncbi:MAG: hypothetical protein NTZ16_00055 [Verrucomicrobia bacterium]|nr:hypothetical protein [Verrucomicrobiota bacterium]